MESSYRIVEPKPKKLSLKLKLFVYIGWNVSTLLIAAINFIQNDPARTTTLLAYLGNVVIMNSIFWYAFRSRDRISSGS